ncbi:M23 family metallopeptidase [Streptomyces sp. PTD5-9]|uniref:M23 family metallopeptidase n=1 Tax=Streptomyces sp. PTD5-9 TaxID=3120150 RepID=UPI00300A50A8
MPISGNHRRTKSSVIARGVAAAGVGAAVIALPLFGAAGAHAATPASAPAAAHTVPAQRAAEKPAAITYSVVAGDYLSKIAAEHGVEGGWQKLYQDNREVIGDDPSLIHPGAKLTLGAQGSSHSAPAGGGAGAALPSKALSAPSVAAAAKAATASAPAARSNASGYVHPVPGNHTTGYRASGSNWSSGSHTGIDFPVFTGTSVKAITSGTVVTAGWGGAYGNQVVIKHPDGRYSQYGHLSSISVSAGQSVTAGQQIGLSGSTGNATGPHLHFEVRTGPAYGSDIDPIAYLAAHGVYV